MAVRDRLQVLTIPVKALLPLLYMFRYTLRKGHGLLDEPLFHCLTNHLIEIETPTVKSLLQWPKHVTVTWGEIGAVRGVIQNTPAKTAQGVPCCVGSMWACVIVEHKHNPGQFSSSYWHCCRSVYVSLVEQPL
jgi:hypothetical protein